MRILSFVILILLATPAFAGEELITSKDGDSFSPARVDATPQRIAALRVPPGFRVKVFAAGLGKPRMMAVGPDGAVYVTRRDVGDVVRLFDRDGDGDADERRRVVAGLDEVHGIAIAPLASGSASRATSIYLATPSTVYRATLRNGRVGAREAIITGIPSDGRHRTRSLAVAPGSGDLLISVGSTGNANLEDHPWSAAILRAKPDGSDVSVFATGLRNTVGYDWHPTTRQLWGMDHGTDWLGDTTPPEELNQLLANRNYGWPLAYGRNEPTPLDQHPGIDVDQWLANATPMTRGYHAHAAPLGFAFYDKVAFPADYRGDAFVAFHGSWNRGAPVGYEVVRIDFSAAGRPTRFVPFLTGFLLPDATQFGRPAGIAITSDGALLVGDDSNGVIYRVSYVGP